MADTKVSDLPVATSLLLTQDFPVAESGTSKRVTGALLSASWGLDYLGSRYLTTYDTQTAVATLTWPPGSGVAATHTKLWIDVIVTGYDSTPDATGDIACLRFNADSGANYWTRFLYFSAGAWNDVPDVSATSLSLSEANSLLPSNVLVTINNVASISKTSNIKKQTASTDAATAGVISIGGGGWVNTASQITSVQLVCKGTNSMSPGSGFTVMGV